MNRLSQGITVRNLQSFVTVYLVVICLGAFWYVMVSVSN